MVRRLRSVGEQVSQVNVMLARPFVFVSKRLQPPTAAFLCLALAQLLMLTAANCHEAPLPMGAVRVAIIR